MIDCHITPSHLAVAPGVPIVPASMNVRSSRIDEMPMIAIASFTFSTPEFTWLSHSGSSG